MSKILLNKTLVFAIIALFIGISVSPCISAIEYSISSKSGFNKISKDEFLDTELAEVVVEICDVGGVQNHSVYLTKQQIQELENLINCVEEDLNNSKTREETIEIFNETVVFLNNLSLLPKKITVEKAQSIVTGVGLNSNDIKKLEKLYSKLGINLDESENIFCLLAGKTSVGATYIDSMSGRLSWLIIKQLMENPYNIPLLLRFFGLLSTYWYWYLNAFRFLFVNPLSIGNIIGLGITYTDPVEGEEEYRAATGWVSAIGLNGKKNWSGSFWGQLPIPELVRLFFYNYFPGITGFTGIKIGMPFDPIERNNYFYFGTALWVKIGDSPP